MDDLERLGKQAGLMSFEKVRIIIISNKFYRLLKSLNKGQEYLSSSRIDDTR